MIPTSVGIGLMIQGAWSGQPGVRERGAHVAKVGFVLFLIFGGLFELVLNISGFSSVSKWVFPGLLIAAGIVMLVGRK